jgi:hypothetical protein
MLANPSVPDAAVASGVADAGAALATEVMGGMGGMGGIIGVRA